jgi:hypothetical protein
MFKEGTEYVIDSTNVFSKGFELAKGRQTHRAKIMKILKVIIIALYTFLLHSKDSTIAIPIRVTWSFILRILKCFKVSDKTRDWIISISLALDQIYYLFVNLFRYARYYLRTHMTRYQAGFLVLGCALLFIHVKWLQALHLLSWFFYALYLKEYFIRHPTVIAKYTDNSFAINELKRKHKELEIKYQKATDLLINLGLRDTVNLINTAFS